MLDSNNKKNYQQLGGLKVGDYIVEIGGHDAKYFTQAQILEKTRTSMNANTLDLKIITPMLYNNSVNKPVFKTFSLLLQVLPHRVTLCSRFIMQFHFLLSLRAHFVIRIVCTNLFLIFFFG